MAKKLTPRSIVNYQGKKCSYCYAKLMTVASEDIHFRLNSGYRSVREQWRLYRLYKAGKGPIAAFPGTSTHNKRGYKQGLDIDATDGGAARFKKWCASHGIYFDYTVAGEPWHLNVRYDPNTKINKLYDHYLDRKRREKRARERKRRASH